VGKVTRTGRGVPPDPSVIPALWGAEPTLGVVPGNRYIGRAVVEAYTVDGRTRAKFQATTGDLESPLAKRAAEILASRPPFGAEPPPWPNRPISTSRDLAAYPFAGRVVVEVWDKSAKIAVRVNQGTSAELIDQAARELATIPT
jgi:hypothetical protein